MNPLSPNHKNQIIGINSIKEENAEESVMTGNECTENIKYEENNYQNNNTNYTSIRNNNNNNSNEEGDHSTNGSMKTQISSSKSNNSTTEIIKVFNKKDSTPIENDDIFKITPHFINEIPMNKNIQFIFNNNNIKKNEKKEKFQRPLTPNLNILRKSSVPINPNNEVNQIITKINNDNGYLNNECREYLKENNKKYFNHLKEKGLVLPSEKIDNDIIDININKGMSKESIRTDTNIKRHSFSCTKNKILKNSGYFHTNSSMNETNIIKKKNFHKKQPIKNYINSSISNTNTNNKIPFSYNSNNRKAQSKNKYNYNSNYLKKEKSPKKNLSMISRRNNSNMNKSLNKKKIIRNISRKNRDEMNEGLKAFRSENKINVVHSKVNNEINNLFSGLSDNIVKDPEIHNKIESLIKDIKDIQQVVHRKTQTHFRPRKQKSKKKDGKNNN